MHYYMSNQHTIMIKSHLKDIINTNGRKLESGTTDKGNITVIQ